MEKLKKISVIETALDQWGWSVDINEDGETLIESNVMYINGPRETDYYHTCGFLLTRLSRGATATISSMIAVPHHISLEADFFSHSYHIFMPENRIFGY